MLKRHLASLVVIGLAATVSAQPFRVAWTKNQPILMPPNENILLHARDMGGGIYGVFGNLTNGSDIQPMFARINRYGVIQGSGLLTGFFGDKASHFMDYTDDSCMSFQTQLPNGRMGIGVARINQAGNTLYRTVREINTYPGYERIIDAVVDPTGAVYLLGDAQTSPTASSLFLAKFNPNGTSSWTRAWFQNKGLDLSLNNDGTVTVCKLGNFEIQGLAILPNGSTRWTVTLSDGLVDMASPFKAQSVPVEGSTVFATSYTDTTASMNRLVVRKLNSITAVDDWETPQQFASNTRSIRLDNLHASRVNNMWDLLVSSIQKANGLTTANFDKVNHGNGSFAWQRNRPLAASPIDHTQVSTAFSDPFGEHYFLMGNSVGMSHFVKYAPNGTLRWSIPLSTPGGEAIQCATMLGFTDIMISSYSYGATDTGTFGMVAIQQPSVALNDNYNVKMNAPTTPSMPVINNDRYAAGATITVSTAPQNGTVQMFSNGVFRYTPNNGFSGQDTFQYTLSKPGLSPSTALVRLNVTAP